MCENNVECKEKEQEHLQKRHSFSFNVPTRRFNYLKEKVAFTPVSCQLLDAGWKQFRTLGKSAKHHKAHQIKRYVFICWCIYYALLTLILSALLNINKVTGMSFRLKVLLLQYSYRKCVTKYKCPIQVPTWRKYKQIQCIFTCEYIDSYIFSIKLTMCFINFQSILLSNI